MSGPVDIKDLPSTEGEGPAVGPVLEMTESRLAQVGSLEVRRALPHRQRRTVGAWCFIDHFGPVQVDGHVRPDIGPHPHLGLQTVTWLLDGELVHHDSLGSEQVIRPGQLNLMTAGHGVAHAEETTSTFRGQMHGVQLWVAQPSGTRNGPAAFEHHAELPQLDLGGGVATVLVGSLDGASSSARRDTDHIGVDVALRPGTTTVPLTSMFEHGLVVTKGTVSVDGAVVTPGHLLYLGAGREELSLVATESSRALLLGGSPFPEPVLMWWNFVARTRDEVDVAYRDWSDDSGRFGTVRSNLARIEASPPAWWSTGT